MITAVSELPEIRLPAPAAVPPNVLPGASSMSTPPWLGGANKAVPDMSVPMRLPRMTFPLHSSRQLARPNRWCRR